MADQSDNLVLEHLRAIRGDLAALREDVREIRTTQAAMLQLLASHDNHMLRMEMRLDRMEARLGLVDPALPG